MYKNGTGNRINKKRIKQVILMLVAVLCIAYLPVTAHADSGINGEEGRVIGVINGVFRYNGKYYRARSEYIAQATGYLNSDGVDLTAAQADKAIGMIYGSIARGVAEGYLYEVDVTPAEPVKPSLKDEITTSDMNTEATTEALTTEEASTTEASSTTENSSASEEASETGSTEEQSPEADFEGTGIVINSNGKDYQLSQNDSDSVVGYSEEYGVALPVDEYGAIILPEEQTVVIDYDFEAQGMEELINYEQRSDDNLEDRPTDVEAGSSVIFNNQTGRMYIRTKSGLKDIQTDPFISKATVNKLFIACIILTVINIVIFIFGLVNKCFVPFTNKKRRARKGHTRRKKVRRLIRWAYTVTGILSLLLILCAVTVSIILFRKDTIMQNLNTSGYFRYEYANYLGSKENQVEEGKADDADSQKSSEDRLNYEEFLFCAKSDVMSVIDGKKVEDSVLSVSIADYIYKLRTEMKNILSWFLAFTGINLLMSFVLMYISDGVRSRGVRHIYMTLHLSALIGLVFAIVLSLLKVYTKVYAEPDYLYFFIHDISIFMNKWLYIECGFLAVMGLAFYGVYLTAKKSEE